MLVYNHHEDWFQKKLFLKITVRNKINYRINQLSIFVNKASCPIFSNKLWCALIGVCIVGTSSFEFVFSFSPVSQQK